MLQANKLVALCNRNKHSSGTDHWVEFIHVSHCQVGFVFAKLHATFLVFILPSLAHSLMLLMAGCTNWPTYWHEASCYEWEERLEALLISSCGENMSSAGWGRTTVELLEWFELDRTELRLNKRTHIAKLNWTIKDLIWHRGAGYK